MAEGIVEEELPAWSLDRAAAAKNPQRSVWPLGDARNWAWGGATGAGVRVCVLDSGVDAGHPQVGPIQGAVAVAPGDDDELAVVPDADGDAYGHGTACAAIIRKLAPDCELHSVRVLGGELTGTGPVLLRGLRWAIEQRFNVINLSLSTTKSRFAPELRELTDRAYFGDTILVASAHNMPVESFPWRFSSVLSVGSHAGSDRLSTTYTPTRRWSSSRPGSISNWRGSGVDDQGHRQLVCCPAHGGDRRAGDVQARAAAPGSSSRPRMRGGRNNDTERGVSAGANVATLADEVAASQALLQGIVELARAVFAAKACSIMSHDPAARELVFEAVAGEGAGTLVGRRIPATTGLAGWSLASEEPIAISDVGSDPRFARAGRRADRLRLRPGCRCTHCCMTSACSALPRSRPGRGPARRPRRHECPGPDRHPRGSGARDRPGRARGRVGGR